MAPALQNKPSQLTPHPHHYDSESLRTTNHASTSANTSTHELQDVSTSTNPLSNEEAAPPTNGRDVTQALRPVTKKVQWGVLISAFLTVCITIGFNQSYGVFQSAYVSPNDTILPLDQINNGALVAFIGTLGSGLTWAGSVFVNPLMVRMPNMRYITTSGVVLMSLGFGLASLSTQIWHLLLTQGFLYGVGSSMLYFPILAVCPEYFEYRRGAAMGIVLSGAGIGAVIFSPAIHALISAIGLRWTLRFLAFLTVLLSLPIALTAPPSRFTSKRPTHVDISLALKPTFLLSVAAAIMQSSGNLVPLTFLSEYSIALGYTASFGAALIAINNAVNSVSRIATGYLGDRLGRQNMLILTVLGSLVAVCGLWLGSILQNSQVLWVLFVVFYGIWAGGYNALFPTTIAEVFGIRAYASVNGFLYFVRGLGAFFGSPVAGAVLGESVRGNYLRVVYLDAGLLFGASACIIGVRYFDGVEKKGWKLRA